MNMNVNSVGFGAKFPTSRINILKSNKPGAENYLKELIEDKGANVTKMAHDLNKDVTLYRFVGDVPSQQGMRNVDAVLINSGYKTTRVDLKTAKNGDEVIEAIGKNLRMDV